MSIKTEGKMDLDKYRCDVCGFIYDPFKTPGGEKTSSSLAFKDLPGDWTCPVCGASERHFEKE